MDEFAWVIEVAHPATPLYWDGADWSGNHMRAVRFARKIDADRSMIHIDVSMRHPDMRTAEHGWHAAIPHDGTLDDPAKASF